MDTSANKDNYLRIHESFTMFVVIVSRKKNNKEVYYFRVKLNDLFRFFFFLHKCGYSRLLPRYIRP